MVWSQATEVTLCVLLWARAGRRAELGRYEDQVLALLADHGGRVVQRARVEGGGDQPAEVQILRLLGLPGDLGREG